MSFVIKSSVADRHKIVKVFFISAILRIRYQTVETVSSQSDGFGGIMLKRKNKYISWLLAILLCFSHSFTVINGEEEVQAEESETYEVTEEEQAEEIAEVPEAEQVIEESSEEGSAEEEETPEVREEVIEEQAEEEITEEEGYEEEKSEEELKEEEEPKEEMTEETEEGDPEEIEETESDTDIEEEIEEIEESDVYAASSEDFTYTENSDGTITITKYTGTK